jgi:hypothetical protein
MKLTEQLVRKHATRLVEAKVTVKGHTRHSKKGKAFNVKTYERDVKDMSDTELKREVQKIEHAMQMDHKVDHKRYNQLVDEQERRDNAVERTAKRAQEKYDKWKAVLAGTGTAYDHVLKTHDRNHPDVRGIEDSMKSINKRLHRYGKFLKK